VKEKLWPKSKRERVKRKKYQLDVSNFEKKKKN
jgi:hypothetical protein